MVSRLAPLGKMATVQFCPTQPEMPNYSLSLSISLIYLSLTPILSLSNPLSFSFYPLPLFHSLSPPVSFYPTSLLSFTFLSLSFSLPLSPFFSCAPLSLTPSLSHILTLLHSLPHFLTLSLPFFSLSSFLPFLLSLTLYFPL